MSDISNINANATYTVANETFNSIQLPLTPDVKAALGGSSSREDVTIYGKEDEGKPSAKPFSGKVLLAWAKSVLFCALVNRGDIAVTQGRVVLPVRTTAKRAA